MKRILWIAAYLPLLFILLGADCMLLSGQITIVQTFDDDSGTAETEVYSMSVDLNENEDYEEHGDKIESLETIGFVVEVTNLGDTPAHGEGYLGTTAVSGIELSPDDVKNDPNMMRIIYVDDPIAPGETREITFEDSQGYIENFDWIEQAILEGTIYFYGITDIGQNVQWQGLSMVASLNVVL